MTVEDISALDPHLSYTYGDYLTWKFTDRVELILGKIFPMSTSPGTQHQHTLAVLSFGLHRHLHNICRIFPAPFDVVLTSESDIRKAPTVVQPDITVICDPSKIKEGGCFGAPDLIVEVISPSTVKKDLHEKLELYESYGVSEYWIVHPKDKTLIIMTLNSEGTYISSRPLTEGDKVDSKVFPGLEIDLGEVFTDVVQEPEPLYGENFIRI